MCKESVSNLQKNLSFFFFFPNQSFWCLFVCWGSNPLSLRHFKTPAHQKDIHHSARLYFLPTAQAVRMRDGHIHGPCPQGRGFPGGSSGKEPTCQCRTCKKCEFDPWTEKIPWRRAWQPTPVFLPSETRGQRSLTGYSPWDGRVGHNCSNLARNVFLGGASGKEAACQCRRCKRHRS